MSRVAKEVMSGAADLLTELVRIDSTNPSLAPGGAGEGAVARFLARRLKEAGLEVDLWDVLPGRPNVVARLRGTGGHGIGARPPASLMLCGHLDVVAGAGPTAFSPVVRDGRMYGRGAADMKSGLTAAVLAAEDIVASGRPLAGDVLIVGVIDEEWASEGAAALPVRCRPDAAVLVECTDLDVVTEHGGFAWFEVTSRGAEAAGADPDHGVDAIALLGPVLSGIVELDAELAARPPAPYGRGSVHASTVAGGTQYPVYPPACTLGVERCLIAGETVAQSEAEMRDLLARAAAADACFSGDVRTVIAREPVALDASEPVVAALAAAATEVLGAPARVRGDIGWMDSGLLVEAGIPCAVFGPIGHGEHTAEEWVDLESVGKCARALVSAARAFCV